MSEKPPATDMNLMNGFGTLESKAITFCISFLRPITQAVRQISNRHGGSVSSIVWEGREKGSKSARRYSNTVLHPLNNVRRIDASKAQHNHCVSLLMGFY